MVRKPGLEPGRGYPLEPKSSASTNSATFAPPERHGHLKPEVWIALPGTFRRSQGWRAAARDVRELPGTGHPETKNPAIGRVFVELVGRQGFEPWTY